MRRDEVSGPTSFVRRLRDARRSRIDRVGRLRPRIVEGASHTISGNPIERGRDSITR